ncbi:MAG: DoxX family membrane protein [Chthoniobacterales bacterium]
MDTDSITSTKDRGVHIASVGHAAFAATMIVLGVMGLRKGDFTPVWAPVPKGVPAREVLVYLCAIISLGSGLGLLWRRTAAAASRALLAWFLFWLLLLKVPEVFPAPTLLGSWYGCAETAVMVAGAWVLYSRFAADWERRRFGFAAGDKGVRGARVLYSLALIFFGVGQFAYLKQTAVLVPAWLPGPVFWAYFTGVTFIAAGLAVVIGVCARLAAALSALQMGTFIVLVWLPIVAAGHISAFQWGEFVVTCALTAGAWVVADSYRGMPWFGVNKR